MIGIPCSSTTESAVADKPTIKYLPCRKLMLLLSALLFLLSATAVGIWMYNLLSINIDVMGSNAKNDFYIAAGIYALNIVSCLGMAICAIVFLTNIKTKLPLTLFAIVALASAVLYYLNISTRFLPVVSFAPASEDIADIATLYAPMAVAAVLIVSSLPLFKRTAFLAIIPAAVIALWAMDFYKFASFKFEFIEANKNILATRLFYCQLLGSFHTLLTPLAAIFLILGIHKKEIKAIPDVAATPEDVVPDEGIQPDSTMQQFAQEPSQQNNNQNYEQFYTAPMQEHQSPTFDDYRQTPDQPNTNHTPTDMQSQPNEQTVGMFYEQQNPTSQASWQSESDNNRQDSLNHQH